jgi:regulator of nonsense transcripts 2
MSAAPSAPAAARLERERRRHALRAANAALWSAGAGAREAPAAADAGLKKNTAYIKRLRAGVGAEARDALLRDMPGLRLEKYVEELVGALPEGLARCAKEKDVAAAGEVRARRVEGEPGEL